MDEPQFRTVLRGYDQEQVAATVKDLMTSLGVARRAAADRTIELTRVTEAKAGAEAELARLRAQLAAPGGEADRATPIEVAPVATAPPSRGFDELGARVSSILSLAEAEAEQLRATAADEARTIRQEAAAAAEALRTESEQYAARVHERADTEVIRMTSAATATADAIVAQAGEHAHAQRTKADEVLETHRSRVSASTTELEAALHERRRTADVALADERAQHEAWVAETRSGAERVVAGAHERSEQIRRQTEHELQDAIRRRGAVHAHLIEVNQLLAVLEDALADAGRMPDSEPASHD